MKRNSLKKALTLSATFLLAFSQTNIGVLAEGNTPSSSSITDTSSAIQAQSVENKEELLPTVTTETANASTTTDEKDSAKPVETETTSESKGPQINTKSSEPTENKQASVVFDGLSLAGEEDSVTYNNYQSSENAKTLTVVTNFDSSDSITSRKIEVKLANGLAFKSLPGMVATNAEQNDWRFDAKTLPSQLSGIIVNATYVPNERFNGIYQPRSGTVIYEFAKDTSSAEFDVSIKTDSNLIVSAESDLVLTDALSVSFLENDVVKSTQTLENYILTGYRYPILYSNGVTQTMTKQPGETGTLRKVYKEINGVSPLQLAYLVVDKIEYVYQINKNAGISNVTSNLPDMDVRIDRDSDDTLDYVYITVGQTFILASHYIDFEYAVPEDAEIGKYELTLNSAKITANGKVFSDSSAGTKEAQTIRVISDKPVVNVSTISNNNFVYDKEFPEASLFALGGFKIVNDGATSDDMKIKLNFDDPTIGVRAVSLPYQETAGIRDLVVKTNKGQTFNVAHIAANTNRDQTHASYNFYRYTLFLTSLGTVAADEYISEVTYNLGSVTIGEQTYHTYNGAENMNNSSLYALALAYYGRVLEVPASKSYSATATIVDADKEYNDESAKTATNVMNILEPRSTTFTSSTNLNNNTQLVSGSTYTVNAGFNITGYPYAASSPSMVKGFNIYLRTGEYLTINPDSIEIKYEGQTYRAADETLTVTETVDKDQHKVYKLDLPDVILGKAKADSFAAYSAINLSYNIKANTTAPTEYLSADSLVFIEAKSAAVTKGGNGSNFYYNGPDIYDVNGNGDKTEYLGTIDSRVGIQLIQQKDFTVTTAANLNDGPWVRYDFDTNAEIIDLNPSGDVKYQLTVANSSGSSVSGYTALIPIPKEGEKTDLTPSEPGKFVAGEHLQKQAFTWTTSLLEEVVPNGSLDYEVLYATSYETNKDSTKFKPWNEISNKNDIRMVKIVTKSVIPDKFSESIEFPLALTDPKADLNAGKVNIYSARIYRDIGGSVGYKPSEPVAIRLQTGVVSGQVFNDMNYNGIKDAGETGRNGVRVVAYEAGSNQQTFLGSDITRNKNGKDGYYEFLGLSKLKNVDIVFINPATNGELRFSPTTNGGSTPTAEANHSKAKTVNITPSNTGFNKVDAGLIAPVTITLNAGDGSTAADKLTRYPGEKIETKPTAELAGHTFQGWFTEEKAGTEISFPYTAGKQNITFYAHYQKKKYKVNYHNEDQKETKEVAYGDLLTAPTKPSKTGQTFIGWFTEPTGGRAWNFADETMPANDMDLYARFGTAVYDVTFDTGSHTTKQTYEYNSLLEKPTDPVKKGHTFKGWFTAQTGGREWDFTQDKMPDNDLTLYAHFEINQYVIHYVVEDAVAKTETVPYNSLLTQPADPDKEGYALTGWFDEETGAQWDFAKDKVPDKNVTLLARFTKKTYQLTFDNDGQKTTQEVVFDELAVEPTTPVKVGHTFVGWYDETGNQWDFSVTKMPSQNKTLKARYTINRYTVTFDDKGTRTTEEVTYDSLLTKPADPQAAPGYAFVGWQEQTNQTLWEFTTDKMPANDVLLIAQFEALDQEITLDFNGGTSEGPDRITAPTDSEVNIDAIVQPTKPGYQFVGWFNGADQVSGVLAMPVGGLNLRAEWEEADQVIRFDANGGTGVDSVVAKTNAVITIDDYTTTRAGYEFLGWFDEKDQHVTGAFTVPAGGATFTAKWNALDQTITFDVNGGDLATQPAPIVQPTDAKVKLDVLRKPERTGYIFIGWYDAAGKKYSGTIKMPVGGLALIAKWEDEPVVPEKEQESPTTTNNKEKNPSSKDKTTTKNKKKSTKTEKTPTKKNTKEKALPKSGAQMNFSFMVFGWLLVLISGLFYFNKSKRQNKFDKK
jgi:uncharacterized repeat protein (TIGR02543 family)